jgi:hypothetical protein
MSRADLKAAPAADPGRIDVAVQTRRLIIMAVVNVVCVVVAVVSAFGFLNHHVAWMGATFGLAMVVGFSSHIWLVLGLRQKT